MDQIKLCSKCNTVKTIDNFYKDSSSGRHKFRIKNICKQCCSERAKKYNADRVIENHNHYAKYGPKYYHNNREAILKRREKARLKKKGLKQCQVCQERKPISDFYDRDDYVGRVCKRCLFEKKIKWIEKNKERHLEYKRRSNDQLKDHIIKYKIKKSLGVDNPSQELITLMRTRILMNRTLKEWRKINESNYKDVYGEQRTDEKNHKRQIQSRRNGHSPKRI